MVNVTLHFLAGCPAGRQRYGCIGVNMKAIAFLLDKLHLKSRLALADNHIGAHMGCLVFHACILRLCPVGMGWKRMELSAYVEAALTHFLFRHLQFASDFMKLAASKVV